jgi:hypothetical protein
MAVEDLPQFTPKEKRVSTSILLSYVVYPVS